MDSVNSQNVAGLSQSSTHNQEAGDRPVATGQQTQDQSVTAENTFERDGASEEDAQESISQAIAGLLIHGIPETVSNEMAKFLTIEQLVKIQVLFQTHLPLPVGNPEIPMDGCPLLTGIPLECRIQIWEYLLYSPLLGESFAVDGNPAKLELFPAILRVNKQSYNEGMDILYGRNTFLFECLPHDVFRHGDGNDVPFCALTRFQQPDRANGDEVRDRSIIPAAKYVQHWKVVLSATIVKWGADNNFSTFCRNIYMASVQSLELLILPRGIERGWSWEDFMRYEEQLYIVLHPLERLRNVRHFSIRSAEVHDIPRVAFAMEESIVYEFTPILRDPVEEARLIALVQGNSKVERIEDMYKNLLVYAQTFERCEQFKLEMDRGTKDLKILNRLHNPFMGGRHPVEAKLRKAYFAMKEDNLGEFKLIRAALLKYLEPQYQGIEAAFKTLVDCMKIKKKMGGLLCKAFQAPNCWIENATKAMVLLEDCAATFARQLEPETKIAIRKHKSQFFTIYESLQRENTMSSCADAYEKQWWNGFVNDYIMAVNDMETQFLAIREARKKLYACDLESTVHYVDVRHMLCDEMIDWSR